MNSVIKPKLTPLDFQTLKRMLDQHGRQYNGILVAAIRKKLAEAQLVYANDLTHDTVTIGSHFALSVDSLAPQKLRLVCPDHYVPFQGHQSLATPRGVALLGHSVGDRLFVMNEDRGETLQVLKVHYQPVARVTAGRPAPRLRLVSNRNMNEVSIIAPLISTPSGDDPGPAAA
jgi:regulator of nucleoside diphosphate kinase